MPTTPPVSPRDSPCPPLLLRVSPASDDRTDRPPRRQCPAMTPLVDRTPARVAAEITLTLPDGSTRRVPAGTTGADVAAAISPRLAREALAVVADDRLVDLVAAARAGRAGPRRHRQGRRGAAALSPQHGAPAGGGGARAVPGYAVRHRSADRRGLLLRLRRRAAVRARGSRGASSRRCARLRARRTCRSSGRCGRRDEAKAFFAARGEPLKVAADRGEDRRPGRGLLLHDQGRETFVDFCVGPHVPSTGRLKAFKLLTTSNAYWKGDAQQPADAARLRHGVPRPRRTSRST